MSVPRCAARDHCIMAGIPLPPLGGMRHFCLHCGCQKHAPCGFEYEVLKMNEKEFKDILDVIAPKKKDNEGKELDDRADPKPAGELGMTLEICHHCVHVIRRSSTTSVEAPPPAAPSNSTGGPMIIDITNDTDGTAAINTTNSVPALEATKKPNWLRVHAANRKKISKMKNGNDTPHKRNSKTRAGYEAYSIKEKLDMVRIYENTINGTGRKGDLAKKWKVNERTIRRWVKKKSDLEQQAEIGKGAKKRVLLDPLVRISHGLMQFYDANQRMSRDLKLPMTGGVITVQALKIKHRLLKLHEENKLSRPLTTEEVSALNEFTASQSWASKKAIELGLRSIALHGEAADVDVETIADEINKLRQKMRTYHPDNIYNMDETGLMYKCLPNRSYVKKDEVRSARGTKIMKLKDRVTLYVCSNASGTDFVPLSVIGKSAKPHCFRGFSLKLKYYNQKKAWSDTPTFKKWWKDFLAHIRLKTNDRVLLILDNCGPHCGKAAEFMNDPQVEVVMLPPNCTAMFQPMDSGVIAMIKKNYRYLLLSMYIDMFESREQLRKDAVELGMRRGTKGLAQGYTPHIRDAIDLLDKVQRQITAESLFRCWRKSTLLNRPTVTNTTTTATTADAPVSDAIAAAWNVIDIKITDDKQQQDSTNDVEFHNMVSEFAEVVLNSKIGGDNSDPKSDDNEVESILDEFAVTFQEHAGSGDSGDVDRMLEGWVGMEDTELAQDEMREEAGLVLESAFIDDSEIVNVDVENDSDKEDNDVEMQEGDLIPVTTETVDELCAQMAEIVGKLKRLDCDGDFDGVTSHVTDATSLLRVAHSRHKRSRVAKKHSKAPRQGSLAPFFRRST